MTIAVEVIQEYFPDEHVNTAWTDVFLVLVEKIDAMVSQKLSKVRQLRQCVEVRSPEKATVHKAPATPSPRVRFHQFKLNLARQSTIQTKRPEGYIRPFALETKKSYQEAAKTRQLNLPMVRKDNSFREALRNRAFPRSKVPKDEYIFKEECRRCSAVDEARPDEIPAFNTTTAESGSTIYDDDDKRGVAPCSSELAFPKV